MIMKTNKSGSIPRHVAIIMDGNGRWAKRQHLPRLAGHKQGLEAARVIIKAAAKAGVGVLSLFAFSSENWSRPMQEVAGLLNLFQSALSREITALHEANIRVRFIGDRSKFSKKLQELMQNAEEKTAENASMQLILAVNYGGRWDIQQAVLKKIQALQAEGVTHPEFQDADFSQYLSLADCNEPDLFIRTSGELRISNYFLWQLAYTELYFTEVYWPDFLEAQLLQALEWYASRQRRFGMTEEQLEQNRA